MPNKTTAKKRNGATATPAAEEPLSPVPDVMTIEELARYLKLAVATHYKKAQAHEIPFTKVGILLRVTGVVALVLQANPGLRSKQIVDILRSTTTTLGGSQPGNTFGWGRLDALKAVEKARALSRFEAVDE